MEQRIQKADVEKWLDNLKRAWLEKDFITSNSIRDIFVDTIYYYETPYSKPVQNPYDIEELWFEIKNQNIKKLEFKLLALDDKTAMVHWVFEDDSGLYDGIYEIQFNHSKRCHYFKQWTTKKQ